MSRDESPSASEAPSPETLRSEAASQMETIKQALRREMRQRRLRQTDLARRLGYSDSYLANLLGRIKGREPAHLRVDTLLALLRVMEIEPMGFLGSVLELPRTQAAREVSPLAASPLAYVVDFAALAERAGTLPPERMESLLKASLALTSEVTRALAAASGPLPAGGSQRSEDVH